MPINPIIHQTWKDAQIPARYRDWVSSVKAQNPGFEYRLWTDADNRQLIRERYPWFLETYDSYKHGIERADAIRYFILYTYGGVYIDLDMECLRPVEALFDEDAVYFSIEAGPRITDKVVSNAFMACTAGHPFFHDIINALAEFRQRDITHADVFINTGPDMLTQMCTRHAADYPFRFISLNEICPSKILPQHPRFTDMSIQQLREEKLLTLIHYNTESWNIQAPPPTAEIEGYVLFRQQDVPGFDIDYVEYLDDSYEAIASACSANPSAIGFNYNGYIKGRGGRLVADKGRAFWVKEGIQPWVCIKQEHVDEVMGQSLT